MTTNLSFTDGPQVYADNKRLTGTLLDRSPHPVYSLGIMADSDRLQSSLEKADQKQV